MGKDKFKNVYLPLGIALAVYLVLVLHNWRHGILSFSDESRHLMDGVFIRDFICDLPSSFVHPIKYVLDYYLHYPALSVFIYYPPFFAIVEGLLFLFFGINTLNAFLSVVLFGIICCVCLYFLLNEIVESDVATIAAILVFSNPLIVFWSKKIMLEMPSLSMLAVSLYFLAIYVKKDRYSDYLFAVLFGTLAFFTKQAVMFVFLIIGLVIIIKERKNIFRLKILLPSAVFGLAALVYMFIMFKYSKFFIQTATSVSYIAKAGFWAKISEAYLYYPKYVWASLPKIISVTAVLGGFACILHGYKKKDTSLYIIPLWVISFFIVNTFIITAKGSRYSYYLIPATYILSVYGMAFLLRLFKNTKYRKIGICMVFFPIFIINVKGNFMVKDPEIKSRNNYIRGYEEAAKYTVDNFEGKCILFDGWYDGNFIYYVRKHDEDRRIIVLRGSKLLVSFATFKWAWFKELISQKKDIIKIIKGYGVRYVVIEEKDVFESKSLVLFRNTLATSNKFMLVKKIPIDTSINGLKNTNLLIYRYTGRDGFVYEDITLPFPGMGRVVKVRI
jgi:hypothetical protein